MAKACILIEPLACRGLWTYGSFREAPHDKHEVGASQPRLEQQCCPCEHPQRKTSAVLASSRRQTEAASRVGLASEKDTVADVTGPRQRPCLRKQCFTNLVSGKHSTAIMTSAACPCLPACTAPGRKIPPCPHKLPCRAECQSLLQGSEHHLGQRVRLC